MSNYNPADRDQANLNPDVMYTHHGRYLPDPEARHDCFSEGKHISATKGR